MDWHNRYQRQAEWTQSLRLHLIKTRLDISSQSKVLEVGCGTGVVIDWFKDQQECNLFGLDIDYQSIALATRIFPDISFHVSDGYHIPFSSGTFDAVFCHYFLLWLSSPILVLKEMFRVLNRGGNIFIFAEPDYLSRIDFPPFLERLGRLQTQSLINQGVTPDTGRHLASWLCQSNFVNIKTGIFGYECDHARIPDWLESEHEVLSSDLVNTLKSTELDALLDADTSAWRAGSRVLFIPTFYAVATKPD